ATRSALTAATSVPDPSIVATRAGSLARVRYSLPDASADPLPVPVARVGEPDLAGARRIRLHGKTRAGLASLRLPGGKGPFVVSASAFSKRGARRGVVRAPLD